MYVDTPFMTKPIQNRNGNEQGSRRMPWWIILLVTVSILPVLTWPAYMRQFDFTMDENHEHYLLIAYLFPIYIVVCGFLAYKCYPVRKEVTYILLVLMWLSYGSAFFLK